MSSDQNLHLTLSKCLSLVPTRNLGSFHIFRGVAIILVLIILTIINICSKWRTYYTILHNFEKFLDVTIQLLMLYSNVIAVAFSTFFYRREWSLLLAEPHGEKTSKMHRNNCDFFLVMGLYVFQFLCETIAFFSIHDFFVLFHLIPLFLNMFVITTWIMNISYFANHLRIMLLVLRRKLRREKAKLILLNTETNPFLVSRTFTKVSDLDDCFSYFVIVFKKLDSFNKIYGVQILNFTAIFLVFAFENMNVALKEVFNDKRFKIHVHMTAVKMLKCVIFFVFGIFVTTPCFQFNQETGKIVAVCRKILIDLPETTDVAFERHFKLKLVFLLKHLEIQKPYFTAAGFFEVNYIMLIYILNGITSYLMVTIQAT